MASPPTPLRAPEHQVAGHQAAEGRLGPLVDGAGLFFKPLQGDGRGDDEVSFYTLLSSLPSSPPLLLLLPLLPRHAPPPRLRRLRPPPSPRPRGPRRRASEDYIRKCFEKDQRTTSASLGFRISGIQIRDGSGAWKPDRGEIRRFSPRDVRIALRRFVSSDPRSDPDRALAAAVYGGADGVLAKLGELKRWFEEQTLFHFNSVSVLVVYERDEGATLGKGKVKVKLVDFAHVVEGKGVIDHNFLGGLCSLIRFISDVLTGLDENCI
uniref:Inositol polyphosphate multikinase n=1 Tax=Ananas comosus var. bracteatus TaxID=296719 RepID=A0A6V7Q185_ANACO|nr:unnamed protein product [Ananas comosus var. bracteatus]